MWQEHRKVKVSPLLSLEFFRQATVVWVISISVILKTSSLLVTEAVIEFVPTAAAITVDGDCGVSGVWSGGSESAWKSEEAVPLQRPASAGSESRKYSDDAGSETKIQT